ncbi:MAG: hypothetical protein ACREXW_01235 [Gammaproteobacteria bacterium]
MKPTDPNAPDNGAGGDGLNTKGLPEDIIEQVQEKILDPMIKLVNAGNVQSLRSKVRSTEIR